MRIRVKDLDADMISASVVVVLDRTRDPGDAAPSEQGIREVTRGSSRLPHTE